MKFNVESILGDFERLRPSWALHAQSNLPGKLLLRALSHISTRADVLAWLILGLSNLGGVLLYIFVRDRFADRFVAGLSMILYLFTPAKLYFFPLLNTVIPVLVLACACLLMRWLHTGRTDLRSVLRGRSVWTDSLRADSSRRRRAVRALLVRAIVDDRMLVRSAVLQIGVGLLTFVAMHFAMILWFGFDLISAFRDVAADASAFNVLAGRLVTHLGSTERPRFSLWCRLVPDSAIRGGAGRWPDRIEKGAGDLPHRLHRAHVLGDSCDGRPGGRYWRAQGRSDPPLDLPRVPLANPGGICLLLA